MGEEVPKENASFGSNEVTLSVNHQINTDVPHEVSHPINSDRSDESGQATDMTGNGPFAEKEPVTLSEKPPASQQSATPSKINTTNDGCSNTPSSSKYFAKKKPSRASRGSKKSKEESITEIEKVKEQILQKLKALNDEELEMDDDGRTLEIIDQLHRKLIKIEAELLKHVVYEDAEYEDLENQSTGAYERIVITNTELTPLNYMLTKYVNVLTTREDRRARYRCVTYAKVKEMLEEIQSKGDCTIFDTIVPKDPEQYDIFIAKVVEEVNLFCRMKRTTDLVDAYEEKEKKPINDRAHLGEDNATDESAKKEVEMNSVLPETSLGQKFIELVKKGELGSEEVNEDVIDLSEDEDDLADDEEVEENDVDAAANTPIVDAQSNNTDAAEPSSSVNVSPPASNEQANKRNEAENGDDRSCVSGPPSPVSVIELEDNSDDEDECCSCADDDDDSYESDGSSIECIVTDIKPSVKQLEKNGCAENNNESRLPACDSLKIVGEAEKSAETTKQQTAESIEPKSDDDSIADVNKSRAVDTSTDSIQHLKISTNLDKRKYIEELENSESKRARYESLNRAQTEVIDIDSDEEGDDDDIQILYEGSANKILANAE